MHGVSAELGGRGEPTPGGGGARPMVASLHGFPLERRSRARVGTIWRRWGHGHDNRAEKPNRGGAAGYR
jgi:hypothetical protein